MRSQSLFFNNLYKVLSLCIIMAKEFNEKDFREQMLKCAITYLECIKELVRTLSFEQEEKEESLTKD